MAGKNPKKTEIATTSKIAVKTRRRKKKQQTGEKSCRACQRIHIAVIGNNILKRL